MSSLSSTLKVRLEAATLAELEQRAAQVERPVSAIARRAIADYLARWQAQGREPGRAA